MTPILKSWAVAKFKALLVLYTIIACFSGFDRGLIVFIFFQIWNLIFILLRQTLFKSSPWSPKETPAHLWKAWTFYNF